MGTNPWDKSIGWEPVVMKSRATTTSELATFWQLSFRPFLVHRFSGTRSLAAFFENSRRDLLADFFLWMIEFNMFFVMLKISIIKSHFPLDKHPGPFWFVRCTSTSPTTDWRDNFTSITHCACNEENFVGLWGSSKHLEYNSYYK